MSDGIGGTAQWLAGVAVGAGVICWGVLPGMVGLGTQRSPQNGDLAKPGDVAQWFAANIARVSGDFAVTFQRDRVQGPVAGSSNLGGNGYGRQLLPQTYSIPQNAAPRNDLGLPMTQGSMSTSPVQCAGTQDKNCDGLVTLDELETPSP
ncbi:hypothetical protein ACKFKF_15285 [Phormidesmis sp. 146-12]